MIKIHRLRYEGDCKRLDRLLNSGWNILRVDSSHGNDNFIVYVLEKK